MDDEDKQVITGKEESSLPADAEHQEDQVSLPTDADRAVKSNTAPVYDEIEYSILQRLSRYMARNPWTHFSIAMVIAVALAVIGFVVGNFSPAIDNAGWNSRGTLISNRQTQMLLVSRNSDLLAAGDSHWDELLNNVQPGWETTEGDGGRRLSDVDNMPRPFAYGTADPTKSDSHLRQEVPFQLPDELKRRLQQSALTGGLQDCDVQWYSDGSMTYLEHLWPVWKTTKPTISVLDSQVIRDICVAEQNTIAVLESEGLCTAECSGGQRCLPPFSVVFFARLIVNDIDFTMSCDELGTAWEAYAAESESELAVCADTLNQNGVKIEDPLPDSCPYGFSPTLVDKAFGSNSPYSLYTSSIFNTVEDTNKLFKVAGAFDRAGRSSVVRGAYDTQYEAFVNYQVDNSLLNDMILAMGSAGITALAVLVHTRSPWLTIIGLIQIILSFPLAYFFYTFPGQLEFFPFLNFIGVFVVFALGADDIFVAVDKWRNARLDNKNGSTEDIACVALPSAAEAMFYTSVTTAVAFFGTAICPVAPLKCFAIFCGLLVSFDYIMCVVIVFPALCLYDKWKTRGGRNCFVSCHSCHKYEEHGPDLDGEESKPSLIRRILTSCYNGLHFVRWPLLVCCFAALVVSAYFGSGLSLPDSADVRLLNPKTSQYEQNFQWRLNLLFDALSKKGGSAGYVIWGVEPADTGNHNNPAEWSQLKLDDSFNPSTEDAQLYLAGFCEDFFAEDFAEKTDPDYICSMNQFDLYLQEQANSTSPDANYVDFCNGATGLPLPQEDFDTCITAWAQSTGATNILSRNGVVEIIFVKFQARVRFDSPYDVLNKEWAMIEKWMSTERDVAPSGLKGMYHSSMDFWWYDTNGQMLSTAYGGAGIALGAAAVVVLLSSRSFLLTIYSLLTIVYILAATTAMLVASGWTLGFLESICFAILIGVSCDFVLHFGHSYASLPGNVSHHERTMYAMVIMGPSILAAAFTTICSALIMIFTVITFFQRFATILFYTIVQATIGSFIFFTTLTDTLGPTQPTFLFDLLCNKMCSNKKEEVKALVSETEPEPANNVVERGSTPLDSTETAKNLESKNQA